MEQLSGNRAQDPLNLDTLVLVKQTINKAYQEEEQRSKEAKPNLNTFNLPLVRIKKIIKSDSDVGLIGAEVPSLFSKACELFLAQLATEGWQFTSSSGRSILAKEDLAKAIHENPQFDFLSDIVPHVPGSSSSTATPHSHGYIDENPSKKQKGNHYAAPPPPVEVQEEIKFLPADVNQLLFRSATLLPQLLQKPAATPSSSNSTASRSHNSVSLTSNTHPSMVHLIYQMQQAQHQQPETLPHPLHPDPELPTHHQLEDTPQPLHSQEDPSASSNTSNAINSLSTPIPLDHHEVHQEDPLHFPSTE